MNNKLTNGIDAKAGVAALQPEIELILCCARTVLSPVMVDRVQQLAQTSIDWLQLAQIAARHGVAPLLYWNLSQFCSERIPQKLLNQFQEGFYANAQYNFYLTHKLLKLISLFEQHQIPVVSYKGPMLTLLAYDNLALRGFRDLDLLVPQQAVLEAKHLLSSEGYELQLPDSEPKHTAFLKTMTAAQEQWFLKRHWEYHLNHPQEDVNIDLHWRLLPEHFSARLNFQNLSEDLEPFVLLDRPIKSFSVEVLLLILCMHGGKDGWKRLSQICDIAELIRSRPEINWDAVLVKAEQFNCSRMLLLGLYLANNLLAIPLPEAIWQRIRFHSTKIAALATQVQQQLFPTTPTKESFESLKIHNSWFQLQIKDRWQDQVQCLLYWLKPSVADWILLSLPSPLLFLYYPLRLLRMLLRYGWKIWDNKRLL